MAVTIDARDDARLDGSRSPKGDHATRGGGPDSSRERRRRQEHPVLADPGTQFPPTPELSSPEVRTSEVPNDKAAASPHVNVSDRYTCSCGNNWPKSKGDVCYQCRKSVRSGRLQREYGDRYGANHHAGLAATEPGKYDILLFDGDEPKPNPPPMAPEIVANLEAEAIENGYRKVGGQWTKTC